MGVGLDDLNDPHLVAVQVPGESRPVGTGRLDHGRQCWPETGQIDRMPRSSTQSRHVWGAPFAPVAKHHRDRCVPAAHPEPRRRSRSNHPFVDPTGCRSAEVNSLGEVQTSLVSTGSAPPSPVPAAPEESSTFGCRRGTGHPRGVWLIRTVIMVRGLERCS